MRNTHHDGPSAGRPVRKQFIAVWHSTIDRMRWNGTKASLPRVSRSLGAALVAGTIAFSGAALAAPAANAASGVTQYNFPAPGGTLPDGDTGAGMGQTYNESGANGASVNNVSLGSSFTPATEGIIHTFCLNYGVPFNSSGSWVENQLYAQQAARAAWVIQNYAYKTPADDAAIAEMIHWYVEGVTTNPILNALNQTPDGATTFARAQQLWDASAPFTGSYTKAAPLLQANPAKPGTGTISNTQIASATAANIGAPVTFTLVDSTTGQPATNVVFDANGKNTINGTSGDTLTYHGAGASETVKVVETVSEPDHLRVFSQAGNQTQTTAPAMADLSGASQDVPVVVSFQPTATSTAPALLNPGDPITDVIRPTTADGLPWMTDPATGNNIPVTYQLDVYHSDTDLGTLTAAPAGLAPIATSTAVSDGTKDVTISIPGMVAPAHGYTYRVLSVKKASQPAQWQQYITGDWTAAFNAANESSLVKWSPKVTTHISFQPGGKVCDLAEVTDNNPAQKVTVALHLYMTNQGVVTGGTDQLPADAKDLGIVNVDITGNGSATGCITLTGQQLIDLWTHGYQKGNTFFQESIAATPTTNAFTGKYRLPDETKPLPMPTGSTTASANGTAPLSGAYDTFHATGPFDILNGIPGLSFRFQSSAYKFGSALDGSDQAVCLSTYWTSDWFTFNAAKDYQTNTHTISFTGQTGYVETVVADLTLNGQTTTTTLHTGNCGEVSEGTTTFPAGATVTLDKPSAPNAPAAIANTGHQAAPADDVFTWLPIVGGITGVAGLVILAGYLVQRSRTRKKAVAAGVEDTTVDGMLGQ
jgi:hypothetical protein